MKKYNILVALTALSLSGCTSIFGGSSAPGMAYVGNLAEVKTAREGETIAYAKSKDGKETFVYIFKGVDSKGGIHIVKMLRQTETEGKNTGGMLTWLTGDDGDPAANEFVFQPEQTLRVSPGVHVVFIRAAPGDLQYRVILVNG